MRTLRLRLQPVIFLVALALLGYGLGAVPAAARPRCAGILATKVGTLGNDLLKGTRRADALVGLKGNDRLRGLDGSDKLCGGRGNDTMEGGVGKDKLMGDSGRDLALGAAGADTIKGGGGNDTLKGGGGKDTISSSGGADKLLGGGGDDVLDGGTGVDNINGGPGYDRCSRGETYTNCEEVPSSEVIISLGSQSSIDVATTDMAPGDRALRVIDLVNEGPGTFLVATLTTTPPISSLLDTDPDDGLQMAVDRCSVSWTETGPPLAYTCAGTESSVVAARPVIGDSLPLTGSPALTSGNTDHLLVTLTLPDTAGNEFQGAMSRIRYTFVTS